MLVYGQSGTGKTSLIQCGLANRFKPTDWFELFVRRKDNINSSLDREIRRHAQTPIADKATVAEAIQSLYLDHLRPVYLIFDQFEELFILGSADEQQTFIHTIAALLKSDVACKVVIVMREEYIAMLYEFEKAVPSLFNKRLRVEPMSLRNVEQVIIGTTAAFGIALEKNEVTAQQIIDNLSDHRAGVQLSYLQVYLDKLYRDAAKVQNGQSGAEPRIIFTEELVRRTGALGDVMAEFLEEQTAAIQKDMKGRFPAIPADAVQRILEEFATLEGTKLPMSREEIADRLQVFNAIIDPCLMAFENSRFVRNAEGVYELAHDTLAGRIADKRSGERKNLLKVQKLIKDRYSAYEQTHTYLNNEELGFTRPYLTQLSLTADEANFVKKSADKVRRKRLGLVAVTTSIVLVLAGLTLWALSGERRAEKTIAEARGFTDDLMFHMLDGLRTIEKTEDIRSELVRKVGALHGKLSQLGAENDQSTKFWVSILQGDIAIERKKPLEAHKAFSEAMDTAKSLADPDNKDWRRNLSISYGKLGDLESSKVDADFEAARKWFNDSLQIDKSLTEHDPSNKNWQRDLFISYMRLGQLEGKIERFEAARAMYTDALKIGQALAADRSNTQAQRDLRDLSTHLIRLGHVAYKAAKSYESSEATHAREMYTAALNVAEGLAEDDLSDKDWRELCTSYARHGELQAKVHNLDDARTALNKALKIATRLVGVDPTNTESQRELFRIFMQLGDIEVKAQQFKIARSAFDEASKIADRLAKNQHNPDSQDARKRIADLP